MPPAKEARPLGQAALVALGINGVVGVGIFFAPSSVAANLPGPAGVLVYVAAAALLLPIAIGYAALGQRFPIDGGPYVWASAAFGPRAAFSIGWVSYVSSLFSVAAVVSGLSLHAAPLAGITSEPGQRAVAVAFVVALAAVASSGLRLSAVVWTGFTALKLVPLVALVAVGVALYGSIPAPAAAPSASPTLHAVSRALLVVIFASQGFEIVPILAGSVRRPERSVPVATVVSLLAATGLYAALHGVSVHAVPELGQTRTPLVAAAARYGGGGLAALVDAGANVSALGIAFGMLNTTPRYLAALGNPESFGPFIGQTDDRHVPQRALWLTAAVTVVLLLGSRATTELFVLSSLAVLLQYCVVLASLFVLAQRRVHGLGPRHLWPVPLSVLGVVFASQGAERREITVAVSVVLLGEGIRWLRARVVRCTSIR